MDHKIVLMVLFTIVLGMLVANMFKDVCGCKVVEGQCTDAVCYDPSAGGINYYCHSPLSSEILCVPKSNLVSDPINNCTGYSEWAQQYGSGAEYGGNLSEYCGSPSGADSQCCTWSSSPYSNWSQTISFSDEGCLVISDEDHDGS